jgi:metal-responsive CopG/Arc/MetJ family transcriptional regulator
MAMTPTSMSIDDETLERINQIQRETGLNRSETIRLAISKYPEAKALEKRLAKIERTLNEIHKRQG